METQRQVVCERQSTQAGERCVQRRCVWHRKEKREGGLKGREDRQERRESAGVQEKVATQKVQPNSPRTNTKMVGRRDERGEMREKNR